MISPTTSLMPFLPVKRISFNKVNGPTSTGLVSMPKALASLYSSNGLVPTRLILVEFSNSGTM